jgi:hypothetical protein
VHSFQIKGGDIVRGGEVAWTTADNNQRSKRHYVKSKIAANPIWSDGDFWDKALIQCVSEALQHSKVMSTLHQQAMAEKRKTNEPLPTGKALRWHDLLPRQREQAAEQVRDIVCAQLTALAHSIYEYDERGGGSKGAVERAKKFVRRMSVRYGLGIGARQMLLDHLVEMKRAAKKGGR